MLRKQVVEKLTDWNTRIERKIIILQNAAKVYMIIGLFDKVCISVLSTVLVCLSSLAVGLSIKDSIFICVLVFQIFLAVFNAVEMIVSPMKRASECSTCSKAYQELSREIGVEIDDLYKTGDAFESEESEISLNLREKYNYISLLFSSKEQLILQTEPSIFFTSMGRQILDNHSLQSNPSTPRNMTSLDS